MRFIKRTNKTQMKVSRSCLLRHSIRAMSASMITNSLLLRTSSHSNLCNRSLQQAMTTSIKSNTTGLSNFHAHYFLIKAGRHSGNTE
jgi:hypothetical protein